MVRMKTVSAVVALAVVVSGCSDGGPETGEPAAESAKTEAPVDTGPPAVDDVTTLDGVAYASLTGDAAAGKASFAQCRTCHVIEPGMNRLGPTLADIIDRKAGGVAGFKYSEATTNSGIVWTEEKLNQFLEKPARVIPKTKMFYAGTPDAQTRANLIAYLKNPG
ncbi:c-type cytochrome [Sphingorhabdus sp. 109]|uniref:c-type cytochrome n=1 Tax=Sphingorhabdus sp. 109 TaxID=2653173 RepID=UPI0012F1039C|nr:c-type cytochrome [Sphingorhabdus sp. 109]VWX59879.1 Cytochrome C [Sphingorhabdus sp. 109]